MIYYNQKLKNVATELRNNPTDAEKRMWDILRFHFPELSFLRQKPLNQFIVDFYCHKKKLIIEVDGEVHEKIKQRDWERDQIFLHKFGLKTIRFTNEEVLGNWEKVISILKKELELEHSPSL